MKPSKYTILFLTAAIAGSAGVYALVAAQMSQQRQATEARLAARELAIAQMRQATAGIADVQKKVADLSQAATAVESRLAPEHDLDRITRDIWQLADADSLQTQMIQPLPICQLGNYSQQPVELQFTGDFDAFYSFILQLEGMPRLMRITHLALHCLPDEPGGVSARLTIGIFYKCDTGQPNQTNETSEAAAVTPP